ncbi:flavin reductase family protein [Amycolatopsis carbonis]|uniref:Flavin reductase family protein n=1 Tax=Amycolatopsis carbonis TaxID=715471 RepID=A0A9Y2I9U8_9PSEU|nr:flavin reductase family protein [Amycolatopsis sp. 2-15]WIX75664.1 flavin reductase family protein [Amycolatopsis sp. 2-15]
MTDQAARKALGEVTSDLFKAAMGSVCTPVAVVTVFDGARPHGTTVSAFSSLSLAPPMVLVALDEKSDLLAVLRSSSRFGINILSHAQDDLAGRFATKGGDKFDGVSWMARAGAPHILQSACWFSCEVAQLVPGGDHTIVLGNVLETDYDDHAPLTYYRRSFGTHSVLHEQAS